MAVLRSPGAGVAHMLIHGRPAPGLRRIARLISPDSFASGGPALVPCLMQPAAPLYSGELPREVQQLEAEEVSTPHSTVSVVNECKKEPFELRCGRGGATVGGDTSDVRRFFFGGVLVSCIRVPWRRLGASTPCTD